MLSGFGMAVVLGASLLAAPMDAAVAEPAVPESSVESAALAAAERTGVPVEVAGSQTETSRAFATPTGQLTLESYAVPHWVSTSGGSWRQIDKRLRLDNGVLAPVATLVDARFSPGGSAPMVSLPVGGGSVSFSWPAALPQPQLQGDTAVYPSVLDGVDLRVTALEDGFTWSLVVKSRAAAQSPALDQLRFKVATTGLTAVTDPAGGFAVRDAAGAEVLSADNAVMWDSAGAPAAAKQALSRVASADAEPAPLDIPDSGHQAQLPTTIEGGDLVVTPDAGVLRGPGTVYPVVIDPWTTINKMRWAYTNQSNANKNDGIARVGNDPDGTGIERAFFAFNLASLSGKNVLAAKFLTTMTHSASCTSTPVGLWRTADLASSGKQSWDGPDPQKFIAQVSGHAHKPSTGAGCSDDPQPNLPMEFAVNALRDDIGAAAGQTNYTLALMAGDSNRTGESDMQNWKKFDPAATKLSVEYDTPPNTPTAAQMTITPDYTAAASGCVTGTNRPSVRSAKPWLKAVLTDPDGSGGGSLRADFTLQRQIDGTTWSAVALATSYKAGVAPGNKAELQVTKNVANGDVLRWQVKISDTLGGVSGLSGWCEFELDTTAPDSAPTVITADGLYPEDPQDGSSDGDPHGSIGRSGQFTLGANGSSDVALYSYQLNGGPVMTATPVAAGGSVTVWVTPTKAFDNVLSVTAKDKAGNSSVTSKDYIFLVKGGADPIARWDFDEGTGNTAQSTTGPALQLSNTPSWTDDRLVGTPSGHSAPAKAVQFNGVNQSADSAAGVLDTSKSFSVAAWVKLNKVDSTYQTIISQQGTYSSAFYLQAEPASINKWRFVRITSDAPGYSTYSAVSTSSLQVGVWTHIAGVYDPGEKQLRMYVNGVLEGSTTFEPVNAWRATGPTHFARAMTATVAGDYSAATVGEAELWDRVVYPDTDLRPLVAPVQVGVWEMADDDDQAPRQVTDDSGFSHPLTLVEAANATDPSLPAAQWTDQGYNQSMGLLFDGVSGAAATDSQVVRTDQSFSISAWVRRDSNTGFQSVWGQDGVVNSSVYLRYQDNYPGGAWVFGMRTKDDTSGTQIAAFSVGAVAAWTHLVATYDAQTAVMTLYVNAQAAPTTTYRPTWGSTGIFGIGRVKYLSGYQGYWNGAVDRVRVWQGVLSADDVENLYEEP